jgi:hypothetical protein
MSDVLAIFGALLIIGLAFPALLLTTQLTLPAAVERARQRIERTPWRCFGLGVVMMGLSAIPILALLNVPGPGQFTGVTLTVLLLCVGLIGAAGMAALLGTRLLTASNGHLSPSGSFVAGATTLELAAIFPIIGWLIILPLALLLALGAAGYALLRPSPRFPTPTPVPVVNHPQQAPA